ncbi:MAG: hypothetical protein U0N88_07260, partial [Eggerthellaceae bacterium]|nr:hypothetical protein [Eggerthellaceae bacterium]
WEQCVKLHDPLHTIPFSLLKQKSQDSLPWLNSFPGAGDGTPDLLRKSEPSQSQIAQAIS